MAALANGTWLRALLIVAIAPFLAIGSMSPPGSASIVLAEVQPRPEVDARIQIVWPHDLQGKEAPVGEADLVNVRVYLFDRGTRNAFCGPDPQTAGVSLMIARNNEIPSYYGTSALPRRVSQGGVSFVAFDFDNIPVSDVRERGDRVYFTPRDFILLPAPKVGTFRIAHGNIWAHAANALTELPFPEIPTGVAPSPPPGAVPYLDPKIQIVWPHDLRGQSVPVEQADQVNIGVAIFHHNSLTSATPDHNQPVELHQALNQEVLRPVALGQKRLVTKNGITYPIWEFNNIDVSAAKDPRNKYFFQVKTSGSEGSNIWVHGADGRTYFPATDVPERGCP